MPHVLALLANDSAGAGGLLFLVIWAAVMLFFIYCGWKLYTKAGQPGWAVLIPIYNIYVLMKIVGRPGWWTLLIIVLPPVAIVTNIDLAKSFGKGVGYGLGITFLGFIFVPMLALGSAQYQGPAPAGTATASPSY